MSTKQDTVDFICEQAGLPGRVSARRMFGEFALYVDGKVVGLVCDDTLYIKPTEPGRAILGSTVDRPPYPGARPHFCIGAEIEDGELMRRLFLATADALPAPKPKAAEKACACKAATVIPDADRANARCGPRAGNYARPAAASAGSMPRRGA